MSRYAERTIVSSEKSRHEIETTLRRYGATSFVYGWDANNAQIGFHLAGRAIRFHLPMPDRGADVQVYDDEFRRICPSAPPFVVHVAVPARVDVHRWAAVLGRRPETRHTIHEYDDGRWCAVWSELCVLPEWLPGVELSVQHSEDRWIAGPGRKS